jgi:hypothetical protein
MALLWSLRNYFVSFAFVRTSCNAYTSIGVKQQSAVTKLPTMPIFVSLLFISYSRAFVIEIGYLLALF